MNHQPRPRDVPNARETVGAQKGCMRPMSGPLAGLRIVDLSSMMSGPWAADILGDQGADVIKVEVPGQGDHVRSLPNRSGDMSAMFVNVNRSKRSLTLNLKSPEGVEVLKRLVRTADVVVQNFR